MSAYQYGSFSLCYVMPEHLAPVLVYRHADPRPTLFADHLTWVRNDVPPTPYRFLMQERVSMVPPVAMRNH